MTAHHLFFRFFCPFLVIFYNACLCAQTDTSEQITPRENHPAHYDKPYLIIISLDGFNARYLKKYRPPALRQMGQNGVSADMYPSFPSKTACNHYTLATGLYPSHHGIISNHFWSAQKQKTYSLGSSENARDSFWFRSVPIWVLAEAQGMLSATLFWVGSESGAGGYAPSYYFHYNNAFSAERKIQKVVQWLQLPPSKRPHLIMVYFPEPDGTGHRHGPDSPETRNKVLEMDSLLHRLYTQVRTLSLKNLHFIVVSDHGMSSVDAEHPIGMPQALAHNNDFYTANDRTSLGVFSKHLPKDSIAISALYRQLCQEKSKYYRVYLQKDIPAYLHYNTADDYHQRLPDILLLANHPKVFGNTPLSVPGQHGYDPYTVKEMRTIFFAEGPLFAQGKRIPPFENIHIYPLIAHILGLKITHPIDGNITTIKAALKE